jgi:hypothetical protein
MGFCFFFSRFLYFLLIRPYSIFTLGLPGLNYGLDAPVLHIETISSVRIVPLSTRLVRFSVLLLGFPPPPSPMRLASLRRRRRGRVLNDRPLRRLRVQPEKNQVQIKNQRKKEKKRKRKSGSSKPKIWDRQAKTMGGTKLEAKELCARSLLLAVSSPSITRLGLSGVLYIYNRQWQYTELASFLI